MVDFTPEEGILADFSVQDIFFCEACQVEIASFVSIVVVCNVDTAVFYLDAIRIRDTIALIQQELSFPSLPLVLGKECRQFFSHLRTIIGN